LLKVTTIFIVVPRTIVLKLGSDRPVGLWTGG